MKLIDRLSDFSLFSLQNRYIPALLLIALFATLAYKNVNDIMVSIHSDGTMINISGRQRMLSQKLILDAQKYISTKQEHHKKNLLKSISLMEESHQFLITSELSQKVKSLYFNENIAKDIQEYIQNFKTIIKTQDQALLNTLKNQSQTILIKLNLIVEAYEHENFLKMIELEKREQYLYIFTLIVLILEAIFIFLPAAKKINKTQKDLENEIQQKTKELQHSIDIIDKNVIYSKTDLRGIITYASEAFCTISGYSQEELLGNPHNIVRHFDMPASAFRDMWEQIQSQKPWSGEVKNRKKSGSAYWVNAYIAPEYDINGNHIGYAAVRHDITDKKKIEKLNKELNIKIKDEIEKSRKKDYQLFEQEKRIRISELIVNISHHWRQPLSMISTCASGMQLQKEHDLLDDKTFYKDTNSIIEATQNLSETLDVFNSFINSDNKAETFYASALINEIKGIVQKDLEMNTIELQIDIANEKCEFVSIKKDLITVVTHLIYNARDMIVKRNIENPFIKLSIWFENNMCCIGVEDNAGGINKDIIEKIFDPYVTTKDASFGIGLGLYKCHMIVTQILNSKITVHNTQNGAKFTINIHNLT